MVTITRKIQIVVNEQDKEIRAAAYNKLREWNFIITRCANLIATHQFLIENAKDLIYLVDEVKRKAADIDKDPEGILNTSRMNATYRLLSKEHLEKVPSTFLTSLNSAVCKTFNEEKKDYFAGKRSLRNYRKNVPIPFQKKAIRNLQWNDELKAFTFILTGINFKTYLGQDRSQNRIIIDRCLAGEYKMNDSALKYDDLKNKWYLLLTFTFESDKIGGLKKDKICSAKLSIDTPIIAKIGKKELKIGSEEEFLHRRLQIQAAMRRLQIASKYNEGGKSRSRKLQALERFHDKEKNYIKTKMHAYSRYLVDQAVKMKCGCIVLENVEQVKSDTSEKNEQGMFLLRNWSYYGLVDMIKYKAKKYSIKVEVL